MNRKMYFPLLLKRALKEFPSVILITLFTLFGIFLAGAMIFKGTANDRDDKKVSVGVVGNTSDTFFNIGINVIKSIDDSRFYIDIISMTKDEADAALAKGDILGYIDVPQNFIDSIASMENVPAVYYLPNRPESLGTALTKEVMDTVSVYITESQKVVAGLSSFIRKNGLKYGKSLDEITIQIMTDAILSRNGLYETEYTGISDTVSTGGYYICGLLLFFLLLWGILCSGVLIKKDESLSRLIFSKGITGTSQVLCEYATYLVFTAITLAVLAIVAGIILSGIKTEIPELCCANIVSPLLYILGIIPVLLALCSMHIFIYEAVRGTVASLLSQFLTAVILGYLSGCFYPNYFFPENVRNVIAFLPSGAAFEYMRKLMVSEASPKSFAILASYTALFLILTAIIRKKRMAGDGE